uniref:BZIP domain-containing protein n=1 Tax=Sinocyclocheilus grahami TaxID=75366 RepID=A0A672K926_SINGR
IMPGQASVAIGSQKSSAFVLKKIMNIPPPNILEDQDDGKKHKPAYLEFQRESALWPLDGDLLLITEQSAVHRSVFTFLEAKAGPDRVTPTPIDPEEIEVSVAFQPDLTDLVLSSVPGGELFNPRKHRFSVDELKPQPMIKKAKKVFVLEEAKDEKYWSWRKKNNMAAKRSRDARRLKENQIAVRSSFLERENAALRQEVAELRKDCGRCKKIMLLYEAKYGLL